MKPDSLFSKSALQQKEELELELELEEGLISTSSSYCKIHLWKWQRRVIELIVYWLIAIANANAINFICPGNNVMRNFTAQSMFTSRSIK